MHDWEVNAAPQHLKLHHLERHYDSSTAKIK